MGLQSEILSQPVSELDLRQVLLVRPESPVREAVGLMQEAKLGWVVVVDDDDRLLGKFTERLLIRLLLQNAAGLDEPVRNHMASAWGWVQQTDPIAKVIECMERRKLRFVIVLDGDGRPVGLTGQKGVMEYIADYFPRQVKVQETESTLGMQHREGA